MTILKLDGRKNGIEILILDSRVNVYFPVNEVRFIARFLFNLICYVGKS